LPAIKIAEDYDDLLKPSDVVDFVYVEQSSTTAIRLAGCISDVAIASNYETNYRYQYHSSD